MDNTRKGGDMSKSDLLPDLLCEWPFSCVNKESGL